MERAPSVKRGSHSSRVLVFVGTIDYAAPEVLGKAVLTEAKDKTCGDVECESCLFYTFRNEID
jgi:hypothetical protein